MASDTTDNKALNLKHPPIVEAVLDIDCDLPPMLDLASLQAAAQAALRTTYPEMRVLNMLQQHVQQKFEPSGPGDMSFSSRSHLEALQFRTPDEKQIVQFRREGFSFNRLAPYSSLDDYLSEIERVWKIFVQITGPVVTRVVRLRYINRILLPFVEGTVDLDDYFCLGPRVPGDDRLSLTGFLYQYMAKDKKTSGRAQVVLTSQLGEDTGLPIIFDILADKGLVTEAVNWNLIVNSIVSLRDLKNYVFAESLTNRCLELFRRD